VASPFDKLRVKPILALAHQQRQPEPVEGEVDEDAGWKPAVRLK
jgi:hypothetical protein